MTIFRIRFATLLLCATAAAALSASRAQSADDEPEAAETADGGTPAATAPAAEAPAATAPSAADAGTDEATALEQMLEDEDKQEASEEKAEQGEDAKADSAVAGHSGPPPATRKPDKAERLGEISDEIGAATTQSTPENPRGGQISNTLRGTLYLGEQWTLNAGLVFTAEGGAPAPTGTKFNASYGGNVALFTVGVDFDPNDHFTLGAHFDASPNSQQFIATTLDVAPPECSPTGSTQVGPVDALLKTDGSSIAVGGSAGYDTAGDGDVEFSFMLSATASDLKSDQRLSEGQCTAQNNRTKAQTSETFTLAQFRSYCQANPLKCARHPGFKSILRDNSFSLLQTRASASATATLFGSTDLTLAGDYYFYSDDPSQLGYFGPLVAGKQVFLGGGGVPIAPVQWMVRPELLHRFGRDLSVRLWVQRGQYVDGTGQDTSAIGVKVQYKFSRSFRMWLMASGQKDTDVDGVESDTGTIALGAGYKF